jgi:GNAT superfamily N-acetyltransferase
MVDGLVVVADAVPETLRLLAASVRAWRASGPSWGEDLLEGLSEGVRSGTVLGHVWVGPSGEAVGVGLWTAGTPAGREVTLLLDEGFRTPSTLSGLAHRIAGVPDEDPVLSFLDPVPGLSELDSARALVPLGYRRVQRLDHLFPPPHPLPSSPGAIPGIRRMVPADQVALAVLLQEAYAEDPVERALARWAEDPRDDPRCGVARLLEGTVGPWWEDASFVREDPKFPGRLSGATVVNEYLGPLLTQVLVAPDARRQGTATALLAETVAAVRRRTPIPLRLVVTLTNKGAVSLYQRVGFEPVPATLGGYWLSPAALGAGTGG